MFNKLSIKSLVIVFGGLLIIVIAFMIYDSDHGERSFRKNLVSIDTSKVTSIYIYPRSINHHAVKLFRNGNEWLVKLNHNQTAGVPEFKISGLLTDLLNIKPVGIAASGKNQWGKYQVDTSGTRVSVYQGDNMVLNLVLGKFTFQRPSTMLTYVKVGNDDNIYISEGFLDYSFNHNANYFRDNSLINSDYNSWNKLTYTYPGDSSFVITKVKNQWILNGQKTDSVQTIQYLQSVSHTSISNFVDSPSETLLRKAKYNLIIEGEGISPIMISAYSDSTGVVLNSSQNPKTFFDGLKDNNWQKIFISKNQFLHKDKQAKVR